MTRKMGLRQNNLHECSPDALPLSALPAEGAVQAEMDLARLHAENLELRNLVGRLQAELLEARLAAANPASHLRDDLDRAGPALEQGVATLRGATARAADLAEVVQRQEAMLWQKDALCREMHHRVANSLQSIVSLLRVHADRQPGASAAREALRAAWIRIEAAAKVHRRLYAPGIAGRLDLAAYMEELGASLARTFGANGRDRDLVIEVAPVAAPAEVAQALALIVCELVTNAFRHGFAPDGPGTVWIQGSRAADGGYRLSVADDGKGLPDGFALGRGNGFGHELVALMVHQVGGHLEIAGQGGARFTVSIPASRLS